MRSRLAKALPYLLAFVLGLGAAGLAACGAKTNPAMIPADNAAELRDHLDDVLQAIDSEDCGDAGRAIEQVRSDLRSLPSGTSQRLQERLEEGVAKLAEQADEECQETTTTETQTTTTETLPTTTTETVPPETVPPETTPTTPPETTPTTPPETTPTVPPDTGGVGVEP
ncbi:MAG: hypothetical protein ABIO51_01610 [Solirubrobacteraceae bacterium]